LFKIFKYLIIYYTINLIFIIQFSKAIDKKYESNELKDGSNDQKIRIN